MIRFRSKVGVKISIRVRMGGKSSLPKATIRTSLEFGREVKRPENDLIREIAANVKVLKLSRRSFLIAGSQCNYIFIGRKRCPPFFLEAQILMPQKRTRQFGENGTRILPPRMRAAITLIILSLSLWQEEFLSANLLQPRTLARAFE